MSSPTACYSTNEIVASNAFDQIAEAYDKIFTRSVIGRAQRAAVWDVLAKTFHPGERILELNCGTGEDALFLGRRGISVEACDASPAMIHVARKRLTNEGRGLSVVFQTRRTEDVANLDSASQPFDGVLSNFSGLNCVEDLRGVAKSLASIVKQGARLVFCLSNRVCVSEILWFGVHLNFRKALRRIPGKSTARIGSTELRVHYPTISQVRRAFAPWFRLNLVRAVGLCVPPSYLESWVTRHDRMIEKFSSADRILAPLPLLRALGDHVLLRFERAVP